jgi:hypothetical protein
MKTKRDVYTINMMAHRDSLDVIRGVSAHVPPDAAAMKAAKRILDAVHARRKKEKLKVTENA